MISLNVGLFLFQYLVSFLLMLVGDRLQKLRVMPNGDSDSERRFDVIPEFIIVINGVMSFSDRDFFCCRQSCVFNVLINILCSC